MKSVDKSDLTTVDNENSDDFSSLFFEYKIFVVANEQRRVGSMETFSSVEKWWKFG